MIPIRRHRHGHRYGWRKDMQDHRDYDFAVRRTARIPTVTDLESLLPPPIDQSNLGSCTGNAIAQDWYALLVKEGLPPWLASRLAIYYGEREKEHTIESDAGAEARDGLKVLATTGCAPEVLWPYDITKFKEKPPHAYFAAAAAHKCMQYLRVDRTVTAVMAALAAGYPVLIGMPVYESFESDAVARTGKVPMPKKAEALVGGHETLLVGHDQKTKRFKDRNSWGGDWGGKGNFTLPFEYIEKYECDLWVMELVK